MLEDIKDGEDMPLVMGACDVVKGTGYTDMME